MKLSHRSSIPLLLAAAWALPAAGAHAGKWGFADKPGGGKNDPIIEVSVSIGPNQGAIASMTEETANGLYTFDPTTGQFQVSVPPPILPKNANGQNQFLRLKFPMNISKKKVRKTLIKKSGVFAGTSFLTNNITITDENGAHIPGIAVVNGKTAQGVKVKKHPNFPKWLNAKGKNLLVGKNVLAYIADDGDQDLSTIAAFKPNASDPQTSDAQEIRIRLHSVGGVIVNGFWVIKVEGTAGSGTPSFLPNPTITSFSAKNPVSPPQTSPSGDEVVESFSSFVVAYTEPMVPESVGFSAAQVKKFNATNPTIPLLYNGNSAVVPNPENIQVPIYPNFKVTASPNGVANFTVPFDVRPINPNNLAEYVVNPLLDLPDGTTVTLTGIPASQNNNATSLPSGQGIVSAATTLFNVMFDDSTAAGSKSFLAKGTRAWVNVPVSPQALYYAPLSGTGIGAVNLDGNGYETNAGSVEKLVILTNLTMTISCPFGSFLLGCNPNTFGDATGVNPIGIGGNPTELGGPTPLPGVNEGSIGTTANANNPLSMFPPGFETLARTSKGDARLTRSPFVGDVGDIQVGDFLDKLFFDTLNPYNGVALHTSLSLGGLNAVGSYVSNNVSDPPYPNPPPLRLPVGLPAVDIVFSQQKLKQPAYVIEGDEVFSNLTSLSGFCPNPKSRVLLLPNPTNPIAGDVFPTFGQNGPWFQSFTVPIGCAPGVDYSARQQIGNFLYVTDRDQGKVVCLNSNNFTVVATIETPDPEGLGMAPDLKTLYVSNFGDDSLSVVDTDPYSATFHQEINRVKVGSGPRDVAVQPDNEDVFVCNFVGDSISIFDVQTQTIRNTLIDSIKKPWQIVLTQRHFATGWQSANYQGYIINQGGKNIPVYESGPSGATGVGADAVRWSVELPGPLEEMRYACYDPGTYPGSVTQLPGGVYVTHRDALTGLAMISRCAWTTQTPAPGPLPPSALPSSVINSPGAVQRRFELVGTWGGPLVPLQQQINFGGQDQVPYDVALNDFTAANFFSQLPAGIRTNNGGFNNGTGPNSKHPLRGAAATWFPDRMYISFPGDNRIEVFDPNATGFHLNTIDGAPVVGLLAPYFDQ